MTQSNQLIEQIQHNNLQGIRHLIDSHANVNAMVRTETRVSGEDGEFIAMDEYTPLLEACKGGNLDIVKLLVQAGASVNKACVSSQRQAASFFGSEGDPYDEDNISAYQTPLSIALHRRRYAIADFLIDSGAEVGIMCKIPTLDLLKDFDETIITEGEPYRYSLLQLAIWARTPVSILEKICANGVPHKDHRQECISKSDDALYYTLWFVGVCVVWIPCAIGMCLSESCMEIMCLSRKFTALEIAEFIGYDEAQSVILTGRGNLLVPLAAGELQHAAPVSMQSNDSQQNDASTMNNSEAAHTP